MSYYNMVGNLEINQATNIEIIDKTNREGTGLKTGQVRI